MKYYFSLQWMRMERKFQELGIYTFLGVLGSCVVFILCSFYLFYKLEYASWIYSFIGLLLIGSLGAKDRNEELKRMCKKTEYRKWRFIENVGLTSPFVFFLLYQNAWWEVISLIFASILLSLISFTPKINRTIPTPFKKIPFESPVGFRTLAVLFIALYLIAFKGIQVDNFNLSLILFISTYLVQISFYMKVENDYFVWIYSLSKEKFLFEKWRNSQITALILSLPLAIVLLGFYPENYILLLSGIGIGHIWISSSVFAKYSFFPQEMNLGGAIVFVIGLVLFPVLFLLIPLYIIRSKKKLEMYLR